MIPEDDLQDGGLRMLEVDNRVILPELTHVRLVITSADTIHSFAIPSLGIKADAYAGRLNQVSVLINREGVFFGMCSEICGVLHSSMPIVIESVSLEKFLVWLDSQASSVLISRQHVSHEVCYISTLGGLNIKISFSATSSVREEKNNDSNEAEELALETLRGDKPVTTATINKVLAKQKLEVSEEKLKALLNVKGVEFDLPITKATQASFNSMVGKTAYSGGFAGVYVLTHIISGNSYVGSSNSLVRRMNYYFGGKFPLAGKFLPFLHAEGLYAFKLKIYKLSGPQFKSIDALYLEQYHLLSKEHELNSLKVVNSGPQQGKSVYIYDLACKILYYASASQISLKIKLGIHPETSAKYTNTKMAYLGLFNLLNFLIPEAKPSEMSEVDFLDWLNKERVAFAKRGSRANQAIVLEKTTSLDNKLQEASKGANREFPSLACCIVYLRSLGYPTKADTLSKYIKTGKEFQGYTGKFVDGNAPIDSPYLDNLIEEHNNKVAESLEVKPNKKNKAIVATSMVNGSTQEFPTITASIRHFESKGIKIDRKYLSLVMASGKSYKGYLFRLKKD